MSRATVVVDTNWNTVISESFEKFENFGTFYGIFLILNLKISLTLIGINAICEVLFYNKKN